MTLQAITLDDLRTAIVEGYNKYLMDTWRKTHESTARASSIGSDCLVRQTLDIIAAKEAKPPNLETRGVFWTGKMTESDIRMALEQVAKSGAFELSGSQESLALTQNIPGTELRAVVLTGHLDNRIYAKGLVSDDGTPIEEGIPFELKTMRPELWERVEDGNVESLIEVAPYARQWHWQEQAYMLMTGSSAAILFVVSKQHRLPMVFVVRADHDIQQEIQDRAAKIFLLSNAEREKVLSLATYLPKECPGCPYFKGLCNVVAKDPAFESTKPEIQARILKLLDERDKLAPSKAAMEKAYYTVNDELKRLLEGVEKVVLPDGTVVTGKLVNVGPKEGYSFWRWSAKRPAKRDQSQEQALLTAVQSPLVVPNPGVTIEQALDMVK